MKNSTTCQQLKLKEDQLDQDLVPVLIERNELRRRRDDGESGEELERQLAEKESEVVQIESEIHATRRQRRDLGC
jgi:hypothetical protein